MTSCWPSLPTPATSGAMAGATRASPSRCPSSKAATSPSTRAAASTCAELPSSGRAPRYHPAMSLPLKQRVLIAEDEPGIADTLQYVLRSDGFEPVWCATAQEALAQFQAQPPALAILDIGLPDMNGFE